MGDEELTADRYLCIRNAQEKAANEEDCGESS